ncbi:MAG: polysaccharide deacetylase family protein [Actinomycetaceae bacterium]|nr:polysaccharide deacetylase family protein [Actinomycetaceae bacterium]
MLRRLLPLVLALASCLLVIDCSSSSAPSGHASSPLASPASLSGARIEPPRLPVTSGVQGLDIRAEAREDTAAMVSSLVVRVNDPSALAKKANAWIAEQVEAFEGKVAANPGRQSSLSQRANLCGSGHGVACVIIDSTAYVADGSTRARQAYFVDLGSGEVTAAQEAFTDDGRAQIASFVAAQDSATNPNAEASAARQSTDAQLASTRNADISGAQPPLSTATRPRAARTAARTPLAASQGEPAPVTQGEYAPLRQGEQAAAARAEPAPVARGQQVAATRDSHPSSANVRTTAAGQDAEARLRGSYFDSDGALIVPLNESEADAAYRVEGFESLLTAKGAKIRRAIVDSTASREPTASQGPTNTRELGTSDGWATAPSEAQTEPSGKPGSAPSADARHLPQPPAGEVDCGQTACVALTFDDGPGPYTDQLLDTLRNADARATFFVTGKQTEARPDTAWRIFEQGHVVGNHSWSHPKLTSLRPDQISSELTRTNEALARAAVPTPTLMRPPYGAKNPKVMETLAAHSMVGVLWNVDTEDWKNLDAETTTQRALDGAYPGAIILMHDIHPSTAVALPSIIDELHRRGYTLVTVPELLGNAPESYVGRAVYSQSMIK